MYLEQRAQQMSTSDVAAQLASHEAPQADFAEVKGQLDWFKKDLFGPTSKRRLVEPSPDQLSLSEPLKRAEAAIGLASQPIADYAVRRRPLTRSARHSTSHVNNAAHVIVAVKAITDNYHGAKMQLAS